MKYLIYLLGAMMLIGCSKKRFSSIERTATADTLIRKSTTATVDSFRVYEKIEITDTNYTIAADTLFWGLPLSYFFPAYDAAGVEVERHYTAKENGITLDVTSKDGKVKIKATTDAKTIHVPKTYRHIKNQHTSSSTAASNDNKQVSETKTETATTKSVTRSWLAGNWYWLVIVIVGAGVYLYIRIFSPFKFKRNGNS